MTGQQWVYPPFDNVEVRQFPDRIDPSRTVAAIVVDPALVSSGRPYLVAKTLDEADRINGVVFGYFERRLDRAPPTTAVRLQQLLAAGQRFDSVHERLLSIENAIRSLSESGTLVKKGAGSGISREAYEERLKDARLVVQRDELPMLYFIAAAESECSFPTLFESRMQRVVRMIENPPKLRAEGFGLYADRTSEIVKGQLRRSLIPGYRLLELWQDGLLIFIGPGDEDLLAWAMREGPGEPIRINNYVLAECILVFSWLVQLVFTEADPKPRVIRLAVGLDNMIREGRAALLSETPIGKIMMFLGPRPAPERGVVVSELAEWDTYDVETVGYRLLKGIYNWFGYESRSIPYIDRTGPVPKLSAQVVTERPLPSGPVETPGWA